VSKVVAVLPNPIKTNKKIKFRNLLPSKVCRSEKGVPNISNCLRIILEKKMSQEPSELYRYKMNLRLLVLDVNKIFVNFLLTLKGEEN